MAPREVKGHAAFTEIVVQADLGGMQIAFTGTVGANEATINEQLDSCLKAIGRQRAKITLTEKLVDLLAVRKSIETQPDREREMLRERAVSRARMVASLGDRANGARGRQAGEQFDTDTDKERKKFSDEKQGLEMQVPILEAQITRLRAVIAGGDPIAPLEEERQSLDAAAD